MGRGPDKNPRKLQYTAPQFVTESEAVSQMGATSTDVRALDDCGSVSYPGSAAVLIYQYTDVEKTITDRGLTAGKVV